jgi:CheY-like chemotaxis protein
VDEHQEVLDSAATALASVKFACQCCRTAEAAIAAAESLRPDLIISDLHLHGQSGLQMCERIRQNAALADVPVMFLSGTQVPDIIRRSDVVGSSYHLRKPFDAAVLLELIDQALGKSPCSHRVCREP